MCDYHCSFAEDGYDDYVGGGFELLVVICSDQFCHLKAVLHVWWQRVKMMRHNVTLVLQRRGQQT